LVTLRKAGNEWKGCCPFHDDRSPSFTIFEAGERFHCFGCGVSGDVLDYVRMTHGVSLPEAAALLEEGVPSPDKATPKKTPAAPKRDTVSVAAAIWRSSGPINGTPAEAYLRGRGLELQLPQTLRFSKLRYGSHGLLPCLVALVTTADNKVGGIQRTFLREDGKGKAAVPSPKLSLGKLSGGAIRLAPAGPELLVTGGVEDGLSLQQGVGLPTWAAAGEGNIGNMVLPDVVSRVTIGADRDASGEAHAKRAAATFSQQGLEVRIMRPCIGFKDFNDELRGVSA
jgi:DNA primase